MAVHRRCLTGWPARGQNVCKLAQTADEQIVNVLTQGAGVPSLKDEGRCCPCIFQLSLAASHAEVVLTFLNSTNQESQMKLNIRKAIWIFAFRILSFI